MTATTIDQTTPILTQVIRGDSIELPLTVTQDDVAVDITDWQLSCTIKTSMEDTDEHAQLQYDYTFPDNADSQAGTGTAIIPASLTVDLIPGHAFMDIQLEIPVESGEALVKTYSLGKIKILADVTRRVPTPD